MKSFEAPESRDPPGLVHSVGTIVEFLMMRTRVTEALLRTKPVPEKIRLTRSPSRPPPEDIESCVCRWPPRAMVAWAAALVSGLGTSTPADAGAQDVSGNFNLVMQVANQLGVPLSIRNESGDRFAVLGDQQPARVKAVEQFQAMFREFGHVDCSHLPFLVQAGQPMQSAGLVVHD